MSRIAWTWILVMLAASPFTAPFSTCSFSVLFDQTAHLQMLKQGCTTLAAKRADSDGTTDALCVSPVLKKIDFSDRAVRSISTPVPPLSWPARLKLSVSAPDLIVAPSGASVHSAVLRL